MNLRSFNLWRTVPLLFVFITVYSCSKDKGGADSQYYSFSLSSTDIKLSGNTANVTVGAANAIYKINVKASDDALWSVAKEGGGWLEFSPATEQQGSGLIEIKVKDGVINESEPVTITITEKNRNVVSKIIFTRTVKELYFPEGTQGQTAEQFNNPTSKFNIHYMRESENLAVLWEKSLGMDPTLASRKFDPDALIKAGEEVYSFLVDVLGFADHDKSFANKYKMLMFVSDTDTWTAFGGGNNNVGMIWLNPAAIQPPRYGILYHELGHSFQFMAKADGAAGLTGPIHEMTSQFVLLQKFPNWADLEPNHLSSFMDKTHFAFLHETNGYHSPYVLEYWTYLHGRDIIGRLWKENVASDNGDIVAAYKRITKIDQEKFNNEMFDAARRFVSWDLPSIEKDYAKYANQHKTELRSLGAKSYQITFDKCPQNYGYNAIKLNVPAEGTKVNLSFTGMVGALGYQVEYAERQGWRYGFVAVKKNKERVYGDVGSGTKGALEFTVPTDTEHLWLVVMGAPTQHWKHIVDDKPETDNQWPYQFVLLGTDPDPSIIK